MTTSSETDPAATPAADRPHSVKVGPALLRYRVLAWTTGVWLLVLTGDVVVKYGFGVHTPSWIAVVHGWVYFAYLIVTADLAVKVRWPIRRTIGTLLAGTVPFLSFYVEHRNATQVKRDFAV